MKKWLVPATVCWAALCLLACGKGPSHPKTPTAVVKAVFERMDALKEAQAAAREGATEEAAETLAQSKTDLDALFLNPKKAKLIMMPLVFLDLDDVEFVEEKIDGKNAEVTLEHTVVGFGQQFKLKESARQRRRITLQLKKEKGRWKIADMGDILGRFGR